MHHKWYSQGEVTNAKFNNVIQMCTQVVKTFVDIEGDGHQNWNDASRLKEFLWMSPPKFNGLKLNENLENFVDEH